MSCNPGALQSQPSHYTDERENSSLAESLTPKIEQYLLAFSCLYLFKNFSSTTHGIFPKATTMPPTLVGGWPAFRPRAWSRSAPATGAFWPQTNPSGRLMNLGLLWGPKSTGAWHIHGACALLCPPAFGTFVSCQNPMMLICYLRS